MLPKIDDRIRPALNRRRLQRFLKAGRAAILSPRPLYNTAFFTESAIISCSFPSVLHRVIYSPVP